MKRFLAALIAVLICGPAFAADVHSKKGSVKDTPVASAPMLEPPSVDGTKVINWTGFYVGGTLGYSNSNDKVSAQGYHDDGVNDAPDITYQASPGESAFVDGFNSHGGLAGARIGGDVGFGPWVLGAFGEYDFSAAKMKVGSGAAAGAFSGSIEDGDSWVIAVRGGYAFGEEKRALLYVLGGYGQEDVSYHGAFASDPTHPFNSDATFSGFVAGAGAEYAVNNLISIGLEWRHFFGGTENISDGRNGTDCEAVVVDDKRQSDKIMGRINFKVGPGLFGY